MGRMVIELLAGQIAGTPRPARRAAVRARARRPRLHRTGRRRSLRPASGGPSLGASASPSLTPAVATHRALGCRVIHNFLSSSCIPSSDALRCRAAAARVAAPGTTRTDRRTRIDVTEPALAATSPALPTLAADRARSTPPVAPPAPIASPALPDDPSWWRNAVIYQVYVRSFADGNGDGTGDLAGVRAHLPYLRDLGVDAIWFTPVVRLAARRRRLRRRRLPRHRPGVRHARGGRGAHRRGARPRHPDDHRRRPQPRLGPAPVVPGGARRRPRLPRARALLVPARARPGRRRAADRLAVRVPGRSHLDPDDERRRHARRLVPAPVHRRSSPTSTGTTRTSAPSTRRSCASGSTAAPPASASTRRRCWSRTRPCPRSRPSRRPGGHPHPRPRRAPRHLPRLARRRRRAIPARASSSARSGSTTSTGSPATCARTSCTPPSTSTSWPARGTPPACATSIDATLAAHAPVGAPATWVLSNHDVTRPVTRYGRDGLVVRLRRANGSGRRRTSSSGDAGPGPPHSSRRPCPAPSTSTRATSSGSTRSRSRSTEIQDPMHARSGGVDPGRDGCRVPLPWSGTAAPFGFSPAGRDGRARG